MEGKKSTVRTPPHSPQSVPAGNVVFRILCLESQVGAVIGKYGSVIKQLQESTKSKIRVEEAPTDSPYRVITITAEGGSISRVKLGAKNGSNREKEEQEEEEEEEEEVEVSVAQEALIRVFEVVNEKSGTSTVSCKLLTVWRYSSGLISNRGKIMEKTGCKIELRIGDLPISADPDEAMIEIQGNVLAVKKALVSISSFYGKEMLARRALLMELNTQDYSFSHGTSLRSTDVNSQVDPFDPSHRYYEVVQKDPSELSSDTNYFVLKILCASCVIGEVIRDLQRDISMYSSVGNAFAGCDERLITIATPHDAAYIVHTCKIVDNLITSVIVPESGYSLLSPARLVVGTNQIRCLLEKGSKISEIVEKREVSIQILEVEQNPKCVSEKDRVVQISGGRSREDVEDAIELVIIRLRDDLLSQEDSEFEDDYYRRRKSSKVTNTSVGIRIPENAANFVCGYGENFNDHLERLKQMTGVQVLVYEPRLGARNTFITIYGTPDQIQGAEKLLHSFISHMAANQ